MVEMAAKCARLTSKLQVWFFFFYNHTAFKLNSLWHAGYLRDNLCGF
jgi:hypothetical protein